jgi:hypothetical protein
MKASAAKLDMHLSVAGIWVCRSNEEENKYVWNISETPLEKFFAMRHNYYLKRTG